MSAILPTLNLDRASVLAEHFLPYQISWIDDEDYFHQQGKQVCALAEKSIRIGWTYADGFKNVRKRLRFKKRDYLFVTKDYPSALEYMRQAYEFAEIFNLTRTVISHGEEFLSIPRLNGRGRASRFTEDVKIGVMKFDNGSRIIAFSANPQAMAVYGGDVGLDEFARHPNAQLLWETAQGRVTWAYDIAVWSAHDGEDTLFHQFAQQARSNLTACSSRRQEAPINPDSQDQNTTLEIQKIVPQSRPSKIKVSTPACQAEASERRREAEAEGGPSVSQLSTLNAQPSTASPWNLYYRVTLPDALELGLLDVINRQRGTKLTPEKFLIDCRSRAGLDEIYEQSYLCNPVPPAASIVDWSAIERCRADYQIERVHLEHDQIQKQFGTAAPPQQVAREQKIEDFLKQSFPHLLTGVRTSSTSSQILSHHSTSPVLRHSSSVFRLGFDLAASGQGDLAAIYIDQVQNNHELWLSALFTCRTDDWHFLKSVLFTFLREIPTLQGCGDESGLGRQICWEAATQFGSRFTPVNFATNKADLGFALMNQLSNGQKRFPKTEPDIAADFFALRKNFTGTRWQFTEGRNPYNPNSHCDIAWAAALASHSHTKKRSTAWAIVG